MLLVTGPVTKNMREALERTYDATPDAEMGGRGRRLRRDGGVFAGSYACVGRVAEVAPGRPDHPRLPADARRDCCEGLLALLAR